VVKATNAVATKKEKIMKNTTALLMALGLALPAMTFAQDSTAPRKPQGDRPPQREGAAGEPGRPGQNREGGPGGPGGARGQMVAPLFAALDVNKDGVIDAEEIKNAPAALAKLDKDGDGKITQEEMRPARPGGDRPNLGEDGREGQGPRGQRGPGGEGQRPARRDAAPAPQ
jgi:EF hand